jgi:hypothetical protein
MLREYPIPGQGSALAQSAPQGRETSRSSVLGLGSRGRSAADGVGLTPTRSGRGMAHRNWCSKSIEPCSPHSAKSSLPLGFCCS